MACGLTLLQAIARLFRYGQNQGTFVYRMYYNGAVQVGGKACPAFAPALLKINCFLREAGERLAANTPVLHTLPSEASLVPPYAAVQHVPAQRE